MAKPQLSITVHQCLFGYNEGHRLLASSLSLTYEVTSLLLILSDLAPGLASLGPEGYWTGAPVASSKYYALMRTWPAPEISRPGCVWTHVLLIAFADMSRFSDLGVLREQIRRPQIPDQFLSYREPLPLSPILGKEAGRSAPTSRNNALSVLRALYSPRARGILFGLPGEFDDSIFAVWSQQWPRLRRSFSFRTAVTSFDSAGASIAFDLSVAEDPEKGEINVGAVASWEAAALEDLQQRDSAGFRKFLWRYGSDVREGRQHFSFLAEFYLETRTVVLSGNRLTAILVKILKHFPPPDEGLLLKRDLISGGFTEYSMLPPVDPLSIIAFFLNHREAKDLPPLPVGMLAAIDQLWSSRIDEIISIAAIAAQEQSELAIALIGLLSHRVAPSILFADDFRPSLRESLLNVNPLLLDSEGLARISSSERLRLVGRMPGDNLSLASCVIKRLLPLSEPELTANLFSRFADLTMRLIVEAIERDDAERGLVVGEAWIGALASRKGEFLGQGFVESSGSTIALARLASILGHDSTEVLDAGPLPWAAGLLRAEDDVRGHARQVFLAFILTVALVHPKKGCEPVIERAFETIHQDLAESTLPEDAFAVLSRHLPDVFWWSQWDFCLRLRVAVVKAYIKADLDPQSFGRLTSDYFTLRQLTDLASATKTGRRFIKRLSAHPALSHR